QDSEVDQSDTVFDRLWVCGGELGGFFVQWLCGGAGTLFSAGACCCECGGIFYPVQGGDMDDGGNLACRDCECGFFYCGYRYVYGFRQSVGRYVVIPDHDRIWGD